MGQRASQRSLRASEKGLRTSKWSEGQLKGSEGQLEGSEGQREGSEALPASCPIDARSIEFEKFEDLTINKIKTINKI